MDIADDIAYSTYDLEDSLKAEFVSPLDLIAPPPGVVNHVARAVSNSIRSEMSAGEVLEILADIVRPVLVGEESEEVMDAIRRTTVLSRTIQRDGFVRTALTSKLVDGFIAGISLKLCEKCPPLSSVEVSADVRRQIEVLKHFNFAFTIMSPRVRLAAYRGAEIVETIFDALSDTVRKGHELLPDDVRDVWNRVDTAGKPRVICDFIAGMTDQYAVDFFARLKSEVPRTIFKPH